MTRRFTIAPAAEQDIFDIGRHVEADSPSAAHRLVAQIYDCFPRLAERPGMGHRRRDLTSLPVRFWTVRRRYMIVYRDEAMPIEIVRVLSSYRDIAAILGEVE